MTPEEIADLAFGLIAPDGSAKWQYGARLDTIMQYIRAYGDERASEMLEKAAAIADAQAVYDSSLYLAEYIAKRIRALINGKGRVDDETFNTNAN